MRLSYWFILITLALCGAPTLLDLVGVDVLSEIGLTLSTVWLALAVLGLIVTVGATLIENRRVNKARG